MLGEKKNYSYKPEHQGEAEESLLWKSHLQPSSLEVTVKSKAWAAEHNCLKLNAQVTGRQEVKAERVCSSSPEALHATKLTFVLIASLDAKFLSKSTGMLRPELRHGVLAQG